jgi:peptidoglycan/LPS O-acetylase OafA/YrhL
MLLVLLTPLFHLMHREWELWLLSMLAVWMFFDWHTTWPVLTSVMPMLFFFIGSVLAVEKTTPFALDKFGLLYIVAWLVITVMGIGDKTPSTVTHNMGILFGTISVLYLSKFMVNRVFLWLGSASFFIFCFHQPLISIVIGGAEKYLPSMNSLALYFIAPISVIGLGLLLFWYLSQTFPKVTNILVGGQTC